MKLKIYLLFSFFSIIFASACGSASVDTVASNMVHSSQIYQDYRVSGDRSQTKITAIFRVGGATGTTVELTAPGKISDNDVPLNYSPPAEIFNTKTKGTTYEQTLQNYQTVNKFSFTDAGGKLYTNSISLPPLEFTVQKTVVLSRMTVSTVQFSRSVGTDEKLSIAAAGEVIGDEIPLQNNVVSFNAQRTAIVIAPRFWTMKKLPAKTQLKVRVYKTVSTLQATPIGGSMSAEYVSAPLNITFGKAPKIAVDANANTAADTNQTSETANSSADSAVNAANKPFKNLVRRKKTGGKRAR